MLVTLSGITTLVRLVQAENAEEPMLVTPSRMTTSVTVSSMSPVIVDSPLFYSNSKFSNPGFGAQEAFIFVFCVTGFEKS